MFRLGQLPRHLRLCRNARLEPETQSGRIEYLQAQIEPAIIEADEISEGNV